MQFYIKKIKFLSKGLMACIMFSCYSNANEESDCSKGKDKILLSTQEETSIGNFLNFLIQNEDEEDIISPPETEKHSDSYLSPLDCENSEVISHFKENILLNVKKSKPPINTVKLLHCTEKNVFQPMIKYYIEDKDYSSEEWSFFYDYIF